MTPIARQRCQHHAEREAVARCPECAKFFCRECISEHDDRVLCTACLVRLAAPKPRTPRLAGFRLLGQSLFAVSVIWFFFFLVGRTLLAIPDSFHDGKWWQIEEAE